jgi:hypothetical protein
MRLKFLVTAVAVVGIGILAATNLAVARDLVLNRGDCVPPSNPPPQWYTSNYPSYFEPNWEPFFRRHVYAYGPILACVVISAPQVIISSKY